MMYAVATGLNFSAPGDGFCARTKAAATLCEIEQHMYPAMTEANAFGIVRT
jgi:hypothetical protein